MTDLVERLRGKPAPGDHCSKLIAEAADEIERLEERVAKLQAQCGYTESINMLEIERLTAALTGIAVMDVYTRPGEQQASEVMRDCAKAALRMKP